MTTTHTANVARAARLAGRLDGVTVTQLADECDITRQSAHAILVQLVDAGEVARDGAPGRTGRHGHVYRSKP